METVTVTQAETQLKTLLQKVSGQPITIAQESGDSATLISMAAFREYLQLKHEKLKRDIQVGLDQADKGQYANEPIEDLLSEARNRYSA